jgi:hypothetical protein
MPDFGRWTSNGGDPSLNEINRTDRFLDALANQQPVYSTDPSEAELAQLMAGWRDEVRTPPLMSPVTPRDAAVALTRAVESRKRTRMSMAVIGSVAAAVLCLGGFGAVVAGAGPGDALYGLHTMLFGESEQQRNDSVVLAAQTQMAAVQQLVDQGQWQAAQDKLQALTTTVATVNDGAQKQDLVNQWQQLTVKVDAKDANATLPPGAPPPEMPTPATVDQGTTTTPTTTSSAISATATSPSSGTSTTSTSPTSTTSPSDTTTATTTTTPTPTTPTTTTSTAPTSVTTSAQVQLPPPTTTVTTIAPQTQNQLATPPSTPSPTTPPSTPLPTPSGVTPLPTPSAVTPLPTPSAVTPLPTPSAVEPAPAITQAPATTQAPAPKIVITTTPIEAPRQQDGPR